MTVVDLHNFRREAECVYDGERYSVRDNGSVLRHIREGKRKRPTDAQWTFGKPNDNNGYMEIASVRVHRIVATAFHGIPPTPEHVVDHIDTNRRNNRPENLRWLTRLENVLKNPITIKRIEFICGSIEAFLADPSKLHESDLDPNFKWMRAVSLEEAQSCRERMHLWAASEKPPSGGSLGEWVFKPISASNHEATWEIPDLEMVRAPVSRPEADTSSSPSFIDHRSGENNQLQLRQHRPQASYSPEDLVIAKTQYAVQRNWRVPAEFPCCPQEYSEEPIQAYAARLEVGAVFASNNFSQSVIIASAVSQDSQSLWVMCEFNAENVIKPWALAQVTFEDGLYVHANRGSFFSKEGAEKSFALAQGLEWTDADSIDDYC